MTITHVQFLTLPVADMVAPKGAKTGVVLTDAEVAALRAAGIEVADPDERPWGRATSFKDADGHTIGLLEPSDFGVVPR